jgi:hypothetical protein
VLGWEELEEIKKIEMDVETIDKNILLLSFSGFKDCSPLNPEKDNNISDLCVCV